MSSENTGLRTVGLLVRPLWAMVAGRADPPPRPQPWPAGLRWTRRTWVGRLPFPVVAQLIDLIIAVSVLVGTYNNLSTEAGNQGVPIEDGYLLAICTPLGVSVALRLRHPVTAWRLLVAMIVSSGGGTIFEGLGLPGGIARDLQDWMTVPYPPGGSFAGVLILAFDPPAARPRGGGAG